MSMTCEWYAMCANPTSKGLKHPILGLVPCCQRCASKHNSTDQLVPLED